VRKKRPGEEESKGGRVCQLGKIEVEKETTRPRIRDPKNPGKPPQGSRETLNESTEIKGSQPGLKAGKGKKAPYRAERREKIKTGGLQQKGREARENPEEPVKRPYSC